MNSVLITGGSGFLGSALIPKLLQKGHTVYALSRHPPELAKNLIPIKGDILGLNLGIECELPKIEACYHMAAVHRLGEDKDGAIWETNVTGTTNVIKFCERYNIGHLYFVSTAYTAGRNPYERSKALCETLVTKSSIPKITIFKPSIIMGTPQHLYPGHVSQFISLVIKIHQRAEVLRRWLESGVRLPVIEPVFRMKANPKGKLNLIQIGEVAKAMAEIDQAGIYWLTHPNPPTLEEIVEWVGEIIMVKIKITPDFKPTPIESAFEKMSSAFTPYLWGDDFGSDLASCPKIDKEFIQETIKRTLL